MDLTTLTSLDFSRLQAQIAALCLTQEGQNLLLASKPYTTLPPVLDLRKQVNPCLRLQDAEIPPSDFPAISELLERTAPEGAVLEGRELKALARYLTSVAAWKAFLGRQESPVLQQWAASWGDFSILSGHLHYVLNEEGAFIEEHIPSLLRLRSEISQARGDIDKTARTWLKDASKADYWQTDTPTEKEGRTVLPLKSNFKGRIPSVIQEVSGSGATVFVEPWDLVEKNNHLKETQEAWRLEILRLLREWTAMVRAVREAIQSTMLALAEWDTYWARARWGYSQKGVFPQTVWAGSMTGAWSLKQARHPFLSATAVPINVGCDAQVKALLLSGPNTGGKTVTLKTIGLLSLLNQWGVPIPVHEESILPVWDAIWTDIGDHQSMDEALSTFSGHMARMSEILQSSTSASLILLDELGSGTDPEEGGALALAFLNHFVHQGSVVFATTHHGALKTHAWKTPGFQNASVEFDLTSEQPTYRILPGIPGSSHAFETARRVGIPAELVEEALTWRHGSADAAQLLLKLQETQQQLAEREQELSRREKEFREVQRRTDLFHLRLKQKEAELKAQGAAEVNHFVKASRKNFEHLVQQIRTGELTKEKIKEAREFLAQTEQKAQDLEQQAREELQDASSEVAPPEILEAELELGMSVHITSSGREGVLEAWSGKKNLIVRLGNIRLTVPREAVVPVKKRPKPSPRAEIYTSQVADARPVMTLDLRGQRLETALENLERQLDLALMQGLSEFSVIHGLGDGILQKGVQDYLKTRKEVQKYFFSLPEEGGFGKTVVQL